MLFMAVELFMFNITSYFIISLCFFTRYGTATLLFLRLQSVTSESAKDIAGFVERIQ